MQGCRLHMTRNVVSITEWSSKASQSLDLLHPWQNCVGCMNAWHTESKTTYIILNNWTAALCCDKVIAVSAFKFIRFSQGCVKVAGRRNKLTVPLLRKYIASGSSPWRIRVWAGENFFLIADCERYINRSFSTPLNISKPLKNLFLSFMPSTVTDADEWRSWAATLSFTRYSFWNVRLQQCQCTTFLCKTLKIIVTCMLSKRMKRTKIQKNRWNHSYPYLLDQSCP